MPNLEIMKLRVISLPSTIMPQLFPVPILQWDRGPDNSPIFSNFWNDFVVNVGGFLYALDRCPKGNNSVGIRVNCEYLAVGVHSLGCSYHKLGLHVDGICGLHEGKLKKVKPTL